MFHRVISFFLFSENLIDQPNTFSDQSKSESKLSELSRNFSGNFVFPRNEHIPIFLTRIDSRTVVVSDRSKSKSKSPVSPDRTPLAPRKFAEVTESVPVKVKLIFSLLFRIFLQQIFRVKA